MQEKETIQTQGEAVVPSAAETGNRSTIHPWLTPTFERMPLKEALSSLIISQSGDGTYYS